MTVPWTAVPGNGLDPTEPAVGNNWENQALFDFENRALPALQRLRSTDNGLARPAGPEARKDEVTMRKRNLFLSAAILLVCWCSPGLADEGGAVVEGTAAFGTHLTDPSDHTGRVGEYANQNDLEEFVELVVAIGWSTQMNFATDILAGQFRLEQCTGGRTGQNLLDLVEHRPRREALQGQQNLAACLALDPAQNVEVLLEIAPIDHVARGPQAADVTS